MLPNFTLQLKKVALLMPWLRQRSPVFTPRPRAQSQ